MATFNRPSALPSWCLNNQTNCTDAPTALSDAGFTQGSVPVAEYENSYRRNVGLWLGYLDQATTKQVLTSSLNLDLRLLGGGNFTYTTATNTLAWDDTLYLSVPGIPQADNAIAAGSVTLGAQTLAYVSANIPFSTQGSVTSGDANVQNVLSTSAIAVGQQVTGDGIAAGTTVASINDSTVTLSQAATATNQTATLTFVGTGALTVQSTTTASFTPPANSVVIAIGLNDSAIVGANSGQMMVRPLEQKRLLGTGFANTVRLVAGQALTPNQACYISTGASGRTAGALYPTDASSANGATRGRFTGFANTTTAAGSQAHVVSNGIIGGFTGLTLGATYYLDPANIGAITATKPATAGQWAVPVGVAITTTQLQVNPGAATQAVQVAAARQKYVVSAGTVCFTDSSGLYGLQRIAYNYNTGKAVGSLAQFMPDDDTSLFRVKFVMVSSNAAQLTWYISQSPPLYNPNNYSYVNTATFQTTAPYLTQQASYFVQTFNAGDIPLYKGCSYQMNISSSAGTTQNPYVVSVEYQVDGPA